MTRTVALCFILLICYCLPATGQLTAGFAADKSGGCGPLVVQFSSQTAGAGATATYHWDLGNGNTAAEANPRAVYTQPGVYMVVLTVEDGSQRSTASQTVTVYQAPVASFTVSATKVCSPTPIQFTSDATAGSGAIASYLWDFGDGSTASGVVSSVGHAYQAAGTDGVSLTVTDVNGCVATQVQPDLLTILPRLTASFTTDRQVLCAATDPVQFTNTSTGPGTLSYQWNFGDENSSTQPSPQYAYSAKGVYTVVLTATSSTGCVVADTQTNLLNVANYRADFSLPGSVCVGATAVFTDNSTPTPGQQQWTIDGNVVANPGPPMTYIFSTAGPHSVTLGDVFGTCQQSVTKNFTVNASPVIPPFDAVLSSPCGEPVTVNFLDHTPGAVRWGWIFNYQTYDQYSQDTSFGGPAISTVYGLNGTDDVELTVTNAAGCSASVMQQVNIYPPVVDIVLTAGTPESCDQPMTETFGSGQLGNLSSWTWVLGDGTTSTVAAPTHTFTNPGNYQTTLNWTDKNGCTGTSNTLFTVIGAPMNVDFAADATTVCVGQEDGFGGASVVSDGALWTSWSFGDGTQAFSQDGAAHTYTTPGVYTVTLIVTNAGGCQQTIVKSNYITVLASPTLSLSYLNTCAGNRGDVTFNVAAGGGATSMAWNFGDGTTLTTDASVQQMTHSYTSNGLYTVTVIATNGTCTTTSTLVLTVLLKPSSVTLTANAATVCPAGPLDIDVFAATGNPADTYYGFTNVAFQYGDSSNFQGSINWVSPNPDQGDYTAGLYYLQGGESGLRAVITNYLGCVDTSNFIPLAIGGARAGYEIIQDDQCVQLPVILQDTSKVAAGNAILSWLWDFGDGQTSTQSGTVSHVYASPGAYTVQLTVQDGSGCTASSQPAVALVTVNGPMAAFGLSGGTGGGNVFPVGMTMQFNNTTNVYGTTNVQWSWNFGDGTTSVVFDPTHVYSLPGKYTVVLTAQDGAGGCTSTASLELVIQPFNTAFSKTASYVASGSCPPVLVQFTNTSNNYTSFSWDFGDGEVVANVADPSHVYANPGTYIVTLTVNGTNGQIVQTIDSVVVVQPSALLSAPVGAICAGQSAALQSLANQRVRRYTWDFGDGSVGSGNDSMMTHVYATAGIYTAKLVVTDSLGCSVAAAAGVAIDVHAPPAVVVAPAAAAVCLNASLDLSASGGVGYSWLPVAGLSDALAAAPVASPVVNTTYTVTVSDALGCTDTASVSITVVPPETVRVDPDSVAICAGKSVVLNASGTDSYHWIGAGLSDAGIASPVARPLVSTIYQVVGSDAHACFSDTANMIVNVLPLPTVDAGPDMVVQADVPVTLPGVGSGDVVSWQWTPALDLSCTDCAQPVCTPKKTIPYVVTVTNAEGCVASDTVVVTLLCSEAKVAIPDAFTPNGDGHNDRFNILGISEVNHLTIYDRWGQKVFERNHFFPADPGSGWDGTMGGQPAPAGVYAYFVEMQCPAGGVFTRRGTVVLVR